jgi:hypothetical protein
MRTILLSVLMLAACAQPATPAPPQPTTTTAHSPAAQQVLADLTRLDQALRAPGIFAAGLNETADLGDGLTVRPLAVIEDSRCPADVECIWAGRLRLRANVSGQEVEMTLGEPTQTSHGAVLLAVAKPSPWAAWPTSEIGPPPAYRFGFRRG